MSEHLRALTLLSFVNKKLVLNEDVLANVLSKKAKNRHVAVISIAGKKRKGKSFFLNFVLRYLKSNCSNDELLCSSRPLTGFEWKPSLDSVTAGITIWPEVFVIDNVAIILMDTQGMDDPTNDITEDTFIMVLSSLFSSVHILNYSQGIDSSDLINFQYCTQYGNEAAKETNNPKGFQKLLFLIRDWKHVKNYTFGFDGGEKYLNHYLQKNLNERLSSVRDSLKTHYDEVECFLMPYPGKEVDQSEDFMGDIKEMEPEFLENIKILVESVIDNLVPKKILGEEIYGQNLATFMTKCVELLNSEKLSEPKSILQMQFETILQKAEANGLNMYHAAMREKTRTLLNHIRMNEAHSESKEAALCSFKKLPGFVQKDVIEMANSKTAEKIEAEYSFYKTIMEEKVEEKLQQIFQERIKNYKEKIENISSGLLNSSKFKECYGTVISEEVNLFKKQASFGDSARIDELLENLKTKIEAEYSFYKTIMEKKVEEKLQQIFQERIKNYKEKFENISSGLLNSSKFKEMHGICFSEEINLFKEQASFGDRDRIDELLENLKTKIKDEYSIYKTIMEEKVEEKLQQIYQKRIKNYKEKIENISRGLLNSSDFEEWHRIDICDEENLFKEQASFGDSDRIDELLENLKTEIEAAYLFLKTNMEEKVEEKLQQIFQERFKNYKEKVENISRGILNSSDFTDWHMKAINEEVNLFKELASFTGGDRIDELLENLKTKIEDEYSIYKTIMKEKVEEKLQQIFQERVKNCKKKIENYPKKLFDKPDFKNWYETVTSEEENLFKVLASFGDRDRIDKLLENLKTVMAEQPKVVEKERQPAPRPTLSMFGPHPSNCDCSYCFYELIGYWPGDCMW